MNNGFTLTAEQVRQYRDEGFVMVPDLLTEEQIAAFLAHSPAGPLTPLQGHRTDEQYAALAMHPKVVGGARQLTGGPLAIVQTMFLDKPAKGGVGIALHQDSHYLPNEPNTLMACWLALSDTDADNGGLCVVPGSHRGGLCPAHRADGPEHVSWETQHSMSDRAGKRWTETLVSFEIEGLDPGEIVKLTVPRGAGVFFTGMTIHGSYANHSETRPRRAFATHFVRQDTWLFREDVQNPLPVPESGDTAR